LATFFCSVALAASPDLNSIVPTGGRRGTEVEVVFGGARLADATDLLIYYPGITLKKLESPAAGSVKAVLAIAPDCRLGNHALRMRTASGVSDLILFSVGGLPETKEVEPNNEFAKPQAVFSGSKLADGITVNGIIQNEDVDFFLVEAKKGERIVAEIEGIRLGHSRYDPYVSIMDADRFELANSDDAPLGWQDGVAAVIAPADGRYVVQARDSSFGGNGAAHYRLHIGSFPRPTSVLPAGGRPGETVEVRWVGDVGGSFAQKVVVPPPGPPNFYPCIFAPDDRVVGVFATSTGGIAPTPNYFRSSDMPGQLEAEPNDEPKTATAAGSAPMAFDGVIGKPGDVDYFRFKATKGQRLQARVYARSIRSPLDSVLTLMRPEGQTISTNDDSGGPDSFLRFDIPADGDYVLRISDMLKQGGADYVYRIELSPLAPRIDVTLPERIQYQDVTLAVPQGNRMAFLVNAARQELGGELAVELKGLPKGMKVETVPVAANQSLVPVVVSAAADAAPAGALVEVLAKSTDPKLPAIGNLMQTTMLVSGDNQRPVWTHSTERLATALTTKVPFEIEIVEPKVPLVRGGQMELKVRAKRTADFKAPIGIRLLANPPGIGSSGAVQIAEGATEATIPLTAGAGADVGKQPIVVLGEATIGDGPVVVSSQLARLEIAEAYIQLAFKPAAVEQGKEAQLVATITTNTEYQGKAKIELVGLPAETVATPVEVTKDQTEITFSIKTSAKSPAGRHKAVMCRAVVTLAGEPITHMLGPAELRIDTPLPPKAKAAPKPAAPAPAVAKAAAKPVEKPLSRLEQLRREREGAKPAPAQNNK
jgi:hypothetical protein